MDDGHHTPVERENSNPITEHRLTVLFANVRGMNNVQKQQSILNIASNLGNVDILQLCETKLVKKVKMDGWTSFQTRPARYGGFWTASKLPHTKHIKSLRTNVVWMSVAIEFVPIHFITCYLQPG
jgi:hypothetical protein